MIKGSLVRFIKEGKETKNILITFVLYFLIAISNIFVAEATGLIVQSAILSRMSLVIRGLLILVISKLIYLILQLVSGIFLCSIKEKLIVKYRILSVKSIMNAEYKWIERLNVGDILGRMQEDVSITAAAIAEYVPDIVRRLIISSTIFIVLALNNWKLGLSFFISVPFLFIVQYFGESICDKYQEALRTAESERDAQIQDVLNNRNMVKIFGAKSKAIGWIHIKIDDYIRKFTKNMVMLVVSFTPAIILGQLPTMLVCGVGCMLVANGNMNVKELVSAFTLCMYGSSELSGLSNAFANLPNMLSYSKRLFPLWDAPKEHDGKAKSEIKNINITFNNVSFAYNDEEKNVLENFNLNIKSGKFVALVGKSGCGKSTVLKLVAGLYKPIKGSVFVSGVNLNNWNKEKYLEEIAFLTQDSYIFATNLFENLNCNNADIKNEYSINEAINSILRPIIETLPNGFDTKISEQGINLSGGQKQRIAIARALLWNPKLLLMDESTSALDIETEKNIYDLLKVALKDKSVLIATHRLTSIINADYIIVMDNGRIVEQGTHKELLANNKLYTRLYKQQSERGGCNEE